VRVNSVHPTGVNTPMVINEAFGRFISEHPGSGEALTNALPVPLIEASDISKAIVFLCSEDGQYITGVTLPVDAGMTNK
jgi:NAD(P)-dependent dehydrogenase (short-subunit alcohol dehydrogenase family)